MDRAKLYSYSNGEKFDGMPTEMIFKKIAEQNAWLDSESVSGPGSSTAQTGELIRKLPEIFRQFSIHSILDIPCGDFNWFSRIFLDGIVYTGADIVDTIVQSNIQKYNSPNVNFKVINLIDDMLPAVDIIFCRDCLVHFSFADALKAIDNITRSGSRYFMATTFPEQNSNADIQTGGWRPINLELEPFNFPSPIFLLNERCTEMDGVFYDKSLGLWTVDSIIQCKEKLE